MHLLYKRIHCGQDLSYIFALDQERRTKKMTTGNLNVSKDSMKMSVLFVVGQSCRRSSTFLGQHQGRHHSTRNISVRETVSDSAEEYTLYT